MANIIRIRSLDLEQNLNQAIVIPVDSDSYGINAKKISIYDLKSWILSGFTGGGGNTSCTGITSNVIRIIVTGSTTTTTTTTSTTTTTISPTISQIYFNPNASGALSVNNPLGRTFNITIKYEIYASCSNFSSSGQFPNFSDTTFRISSDGGANWYSPNSAHAEVSGGHYPIGQFSTQPPVSGTTIINNISNVSNIIMNAIIPCSLSEEVSGYVIVTLINAAVAGSGSAIIVCNDVWSKSCGTFGSLGNIVNCTTGTPTTTTTTLAPVLYGPFGVFWATNPISLCGLGGFIGRDQNLYSYINSSILVNGRAYYNSNGTPYTDTHDAAYASNTPGTGNQYGIFDNNGVWIITGVC